MYNKAVLMSDRSQTTRQRAWRWVAYALTWWIVLLGLWLLFVDSLARPEVLVGLAAAAIATLAALGIRARGGVRYHFRWRWLLLLRGVPADVLRDSWLLAALLWRRLVRGERPAAAFRTVPFPIGGDDPTSAARRAFVVTATSVAPNTYVVRVDRAQGTALIHQLAPDPPDQTRSPLVGMP